MFLIPVSSHFVSSSWVLVPTHMAYTVLVCISWLPNLFLQPRPLPWASDQYIHGNLHLDDLIDSIHSRVCAVSSSAYALCPCVLHLIYWPHCHSVWSSDMWVTRPQSGLVFFFLSEFGYGKAGPTMGLTATVSCKTADPQVWRISNLNKEELSARMEGRWLLRNWLEGRDLWHLEERNRNWEVGSRHWHLPAGDPGTIDPGDRHHWRPFF